MWYKINGGNLNVFLSPINTTEELMQWSKYDSVIWTSPGPDPDQLRKNQNNNWSISPVHPELIKKPYKLDATKFNPSAELARIFELIMANIAEDGPRPPYDYLMTCSSFSWVTTKHESGLSEVKTLHNNAHTIIDDYTQTWVSNWGNPSLDKYQWKEQDYLKLAARFYNLYSLAHDNNLVYMDYEEINEGIRLHCNVGLARDESGIGHNIGITPKSLEGFLWLTLANDITNKKKYGICSRPNCTRVFGTNVRNNKSICSSTCRNYLNRNTDKETFPSIFERRNA